MKLLIQHFEKHLPHLWENMLNIKDSTIHSVYKNLKPTSFDRGIMEKIDQFLCLPFELEWNDLGSWDRVADWSLKHPSKLSNKALILKNNPAVTLSSLQKKIL